MGERAKEGGRGRGQMGKMKWKEETRTDVCLGLGRKEEQVYFLSFTYLLIYLFIFGCAESSLQLTGFLEVWCVQTSHCGGFCCCEAPALGHASLVAL